MPLLRLACRCGHRWEALKSFSTHDPDAERCPKCQSTEFETCVPESAGAYHRETTIEDAQADGSLGIIMRHKRDLEANSAKILSGEISIKEKGPKELRPQCPPELLKTYY